MTWCFRQKTGLHHYLSTARNNYREYLRHDTVRLKKYFYVLRPVLACRWILERHTPPPVLFSELSEACLDEALRPAVDKLLRLKAETPELGMGRRITAINDYLDSSMAEIEAQIAKLPEEDRMDWSELNSLFLKIIGID